MPGVVARLPKEGGPVEIMVDQLISPRAITQDATHIYWTSAGTSSAFIDGSVYRMAKDKSDFHIMAKEQHSCGLVAVDDLMVYWAQGGRLKDYFYQDGTIMAAWKQ